MRDWDRLSFDAVVLCVAGAALIVLTLPTDVIFMSFTSGESLRFPSSGLSWRWYVELLNSDDLQDTTLRSLKVALAVLVAITLTLMLIMERFVSFSNQLSR